MKYATRTSDPGRFKINECESSREIILLYVIHHISLQYALW